VIKQIKTQVIKEIKEKGYWEGYLVGNRVMPIHVKGGWHMGCRINRIQFTEFITIEEKLRFFDDTVKGYLSYLDAELGNGVHYYKEETTNGIGT
jgi:hypothetical protein